MRKMIKKTIKYTTYTLSAVIILLVIFTGYLYSTADMKSPNLPEVIDIVYHEDSLNLRIYGESALRRGESGLWELFVTGRPYQIGDATGKLSPDLLYHQEKAFVDQIRQIVPSDNYLKFLRFCTVIFNRKLGENVPQEYREEIYGISNECTHEYDFIGTPYERQLNYHAAHDLGHAMQDYMLVGCSSFAVWGTQSTDSSLLIGRNFDFYAGEAFAKNKLVSFYNPKKGYKFASIGWPGMVGVLSGMNEKGLTVTINAAKSALHKVGQLILEGHLQHCVREGIEHGDADKTIADFAKAVEHFSRMT